MSKKNPAISKRACVWLVVSHYHDKEGNEVLDHSHNPTIFCSLEEARKHLWLRWSGLAQIQRHVINDTHQCWGWEDVVIEDEGESPLYNAAADYIVNSDCIDHKE